jgi:hypothetical protein
MRLSKDDILKADDRATEEVDCPEWGGSVLVRGMSGRERDAFEVSTTQQRGRGPATRDLVNIRAKLVARCVVDDEGERLFTDADVTALGEKSGAVIDRLFDVASRLSGMAEGDEQEMARDFSQANGDGSSSTSPSSSTRARKSS